jgi:hypothetical protein
MRVPTSGLKIRIKPRIERFESAEGRKESTPLTLGPEGTWYLEELESTLDMADWNELRKDERVELTWCKRTLGSNQYGRNYEDVVFSVRVDDALRLFSKLAGREYKPPHDHYQHICEKNRPWYAGFILNPEAARQIDIVYARAKARLRKSLGKDVRIYPVKNWD